MHIGNRDDVSAIAASRRIQALKEGNGSEPSVHGAEMRGEGLSDVLEGLLDAENGSKE